jgi:hypothetical protein
LIVAIILFTEKHEAASPMFWKNGSSAIGISVHQPAQRIGFSLAAEASVAGRDLRMFFSISPSPAAWDAV